MKTKNANYLIDVINSLAEPDIDDSRWVRAIEFAQDLGASALGMSSISIGSDIPSWFRSSMREGFIKDYIQQDLVRHDPFVPHFKVSNSPLVFSSSDAGVRTGQTRGVIAHKRRLLDHSYGQIIGVGSAGATPGVRRGVNFCFDLGQDWHEADQSYFMEHAKIFAAVVNAYVEAPSTFNLPGVILPRIPELTDRERDILSYLAQGFKNDRIAERTGLAEVTVRKHMTAARYKLGASTREQALALAMKFGLISV